VRMRAGHKTAGVAGFSRESASLVSAHSASEQCRSMAVACLHIHKHLKV
jgi:hypothetical protein